jgi:hypothetical protein
MDRSTARRLLLAIVVIVGLLLVGVTAYNAGVSAGLAEAGRVLGPGDRVAYPYIYPGFGFGFFGFFGALLFFLLIFGLLRAVFGGGRRGSWQGGGRWREGHGSWAAGAPMFEEWHRRMHEGETGETTGGQGSSEPPSSAPPRT